jgi:hypothetical protein
MYIYLTINKINGKKYIGLCSKNPSESKNYYGSGSLLTKSIKKYGKNNFMKEILEDNIESLSFLCEREKYYIELYGAVKSPEYYNIEDGGISASFWNNIDEFYKEHISKKISDKLKLYFLNNPIDQKSIDSLQESLRIFFIKRTAEEIKFYNNLYFNKKLKNLKKYKRRKSYKIWIDSNDEVRRIIEEDNREIIKSKRNKNVYKFNSDGVLIEYYTSLDEAIRLNNLNSKALLSLACSGKRNYHYGYRWSYNDFPNEIVTKKKGRNKGTKDSTKRNRNHLVSNTFTVLQLKEDKIIKEWGSPQEVSESLNISKQVLLRKIKSESIYKGFFWKVGKKHTYVKYLSTST